MWPFDISAKARRRLIDEENRRKISASQTALMDSATTTADAAHHVTARLRRQLEDSIFQFETTLRVLTDAMIVCDAFGVIKSVNPAAESIFACDASDLIDHPVLKLFRLDGHEPSTSQALWEALQMDKDGDGPNASLRGVRMNGEVFFIEASMTRLDRSDGSSVVVMLVRVNDITNSNAASRALAASEQRYRSLLDIAFDGILIVQNGLVVAANRVAASMFLKEGESLLTMPLANLVYDRPMAPHLGTSDRHSVEMLGTRIDGSLMQLLVSTTKICWNDAPAVLLTICDTSPKTIDPGRSTRLNGVDILVCFTPMYQITFANQEFCSRYDTTLEKVIGTDIRNLLPPVEVQSLLLALSVLTPQAPTQRVQFHSTTASGDIEFLDWIDHATYAEDGATLVEYQRIGRNVSNLVSMTTPESVAA